MNDNTRQGDEELEGYDPFEDGDISDEELADFDDDFDDPFEKTTPMPDNVQSIGRTRPSRVINFTVPDPFGGTMVIAGGPYREKPADQGYIGFKLAPEIDEPYAAKIDIPDFSLPSDAGEVTRVLLQAVITARSGSIPYFGCFGGMGRTGTILGVLVKALLRLDRPKLFGLFRYGAIPDPVDWVREHYRPEACETRKQAAYVRGFDTRLLEKLILKHARG